MLPKMRTKTHHPLQPASGAVRPPAPAPTARELVPALGGLKPNFDPRALIAPATKMVLSPGSTWLAVREEQATFAEIYARYVFLLALIPPLSGFIGACYFGTFPAGEGALMAGLCYLLNLVMVYLAAVMAQHSATFLHGKIDLNVAGKLVVYSMMPYFLCGIFLIHPKFAPFALCGAYSFFLFFRGCEVLTPFRGDERYLYCVLNVVPWILVADHLVQSLFTNH